MNLSAPFIQRPVMTTLIMVAILFLGIGSYLNLPVSDLPNVDYPTITVRTYFPGTNPETMANTIATPLEKEFMTIPGVTHVTSSNALGRSEITLQFEVTKSMDSAAQDVEAAISRAKEGLPPNLPSPPVYEKVNPSDSPIMYLAFTSDTMPLWELYNYAYTFIGQRLSMLEGVAQVITYGSPYAVRIQADPGALASRGITMSEMSQALQKSSPSLPTGQLDGRYLSSVIVSDGVLSKASQYQDIIVAYKEGLPVRVKDLGKAVDGLQNNRFSLRYFDKNNSHPTIVLAIQRQPGANTVELSHRIKEYLPKLTEQLPASVQLRMLFDKAKSIESSIFEVKLTLVVALLLVVLVIFLYLGNPLDTLIPSLAMPMSIIGTFWVMGWLDYSIDNLSLLALTLATGFIVDDAIVVLENIVRKVEEGQSRWEAAMNGAKQISFTILSMTLSLVAVFIPMVYMGGLLGKILQEFSITMMVVILASGIISLTLTPMLCSRFISSGHHDRHEKGIAGFSNRMNRKMLKWYEDSLKWALKQRKLLLGVGVLSVLLSGIFFFRLPKDFLPDDDMGFVMGFTAGSQGTSPERMLQYQNTVSEALRSNPYIDSFVSINGFPQIHNGITFINLIPHEKRPPAQAVIQQLYGQLGTLSGVNTFLKNIPLINLEIGPQTRGDYQYTLQSLDQEGLFQASQALVEKMHELPGFQGISSNLEMQTPQLHVEILRDQAAALGITPYEIETALLLAYSGNRVARIPTAFDQYDVILELEPKFQRHANQLGNLYVRSGLTNQLVPLSAVARWKESVGASSIQHVSQFPAVTISFSLAPNVPLGKALDDLQHVAEEILPDHVMGNVQGKAKTFKESIDSISYLLIIAVFAIYIVLGILYESFIHPITILSSLPPAILGGLATLALFGYSLTLYGYLGIILLIGIVKKNGIMMIDYAIENIREKGETPEESIFKACLVRFRPIMMTTLAAIMGAIPIVFAVGQGADARRPLGLVIIGGLLLSQLITLYLTPVLYLYFEKLRRRFSIS